MRTNNSIRNILFGLVGQMIAIVLTFVGQRFFISILGTVYLGLNGLFTNVLSLLSLAELGIGTAIIYSLYKPLSNGDKIKISSLVNFYAKAFKIIAVITFIMGLILMPFLKYFAKGAQSIDNLYVYYFLFLLNNALTYLFSYKKSLIIADQKSYIVTIIRYSFFIPLSILQIVILYLTKNYLLYLMLLLVFNVIENIIISIWADKLYPFITEYKKVRLNNEDKNILYRNIKALINHRLGAVIVNGTDNIIISFFMGVYYVGLYSNYLIIINALNMIINQIFSSITASVGNLNSEDSKEKSYQIYKAILFANFWLFGFCSISLIALLNPFISIWVGSKYMLDFSIVAIISINFYVNGIRRTTLVFRDSLGLFWHDRYKPIIEALINIVLSILLVKYLGVFGVLLGTFVSTIITSSWVEPYVLFKHGFKKKMKEYLYNAFYYTLVISVIGGITLILTQYISTMVQSNYLSLFVLMGTLAIVPNLLIYIYFYKTDEMKYIRTIIEISISRFRVIISKIR